MKLTKLLTLVVLYDTEATYKKGTFHEPPMYIGLFAEEAAEGSLLIY